MSGRLTEADRFWPKVEFTDTCWLWTGAISGLVYGCFSINDGSAHWRNIQAHRWAYEFCVRPIPDGLVIDHLCRVTLCVRPDHLEAVTERVNILRGVGMAAQCARKTHCNNGHPFDEENTYIYPAPRSSRECRACGRLSHAKAKRRKAEFSVVKVG